MIDVPVLDINYAIIKSKKISSEHLSMKWNHSSKPSVFEVKVKDEIVFTPIVMPWNGLKRML